MVMSHNGSSNETDPIKKTISLDIFLCNDGLLPKPLQRFDKIRESECCCDLPNALKENASKASCCWRRASKTAERVCSSWAAPVTAPLGYEMVEVGDGQPDWDPTITK